MGNGVLKQTICDAVIAYFIFIGCLNQKLKAFKKIWPKTELTASLESTQDTVVAKLLGSSVYCTCLSLSLTSKAGDNPSTLTISRMSHSLPFSFSF